MVGNSSLISLPWGRLWADDTFDNASNDVTYGNVGRRRAAIKYHSIGTATAEILYRYCHRHDAAAASIPDKITQGHSTPQHYNKHA